MKIGGINMQSGGMDRNMAMDSVSKSIHNQIVNAQKKLQELSSDKEMSAEEKMKKRQEIQQQIAELNRQLRQHQIEMRRVQQSRNLDIDETQRGKKVAYKTERQSTGLSRANMQAIISADSAIASVEERGSVVTKMQGRAGVLEGEIKQDLARGGNVEAKEKELEEINQKVEKQQYVQLATLAKINAKMASVEKEETVEKEEDEENKNSEESKKDTCIEMNPEQKTDTYTHVDVLL